MNKELVLVTGGSGFIAVHTIVKLLQAGFRVRTTLRTIARSQEVKEMVLAGGTDNLDDLSFIQADLTSDTNWQEATTGASYVIHVASPTPATRPDDADEMVKMAVDGVLRVMKAAKKAQVKRVVLTSASGAVLAGHESHPQIFTEDDWTNLDGKIDAYQRSKTMAELAAWDFARANDMELSSVLPVAVMGPVLGKDYSHSNQIIKNMLSGKMPFLLKLAFDYVDVRDVADLHLLAMTQPQAKGQRFLATTGENISYQAQAQLLKNTFGTQASKVSTRQMPDFLVKVLAHFVKDLQMPATFLGQNTACSNQKAKDLLGWQPRSAKEATLATATSMLELGLIDE